MARMNSFRFVEYTGEDAADVLVSLIMNLAHAESTEEDVHDVVSETGEPHQRIIGFQPNQETDEEVEDEQPTDER